MKNPQDTKQVWKYVRHKISGWLSYLQADLNFSPECLPNILWGYSVLFLTFFSFEYIFTSKGDTITELSIRPLIKFEFLSKPFPIKFGLCVAD